MSERIIGTLMESFKRLFISFISYIFPSRMIATFFGIGYLPDWQNHWAAFFAIPFVVLIVHFSVGLDADIITVTYSMFIISFVFLVLGLLGIYVFQKLIYSDNKYEVTMHVAFGQTLMIALSMPAILHVMNKIFIFNAGVCENFMHCANWFLYFATYLGAMLAPYFAFRLIDILKPWPSYFIERDYHNALSNMLEGFCNAIYASFIFYMFSFILLDLKVLTVIQFYQSLLLYTPI